ncbi:MAG: chemotaxis response regulator protein-glutamate methylesterase [Thermodesulfobacteriota bacterium]
MAKIRLLIVDDSSFMRSMLKRMLKAYDDIVIVGMARDGVEGLEKALELRPDVVTMDIEMPRMNGIDATAEIMRSAPVPIIMVSSISQDGAKATLDALDKGAVDYISKNIDNSALDVMQIEKDLVAKIRTFGRSGPKSRVAAARPALARERTPAARPAVAAGKPRSFATQAIKTVVIGASTGGPKAIQNVLSGLPPGLKVSVLVVVHMPGQFTMAFAERLNGVCSMPVAEAVNDEEVKVGRVLVCPGGAQTRYVRKGAAEVRIEINHEPPDALYKPSVDIAVASVAACFNGRTLGVILTGMGYDGRLGMREVKSQGGKTLVQSEETCTVYGMPRAVIDDGRADKVVSLDKIAAEIVNMI